MNNVLPIFRFLNEKAGQGLQVALVTLTGVTGASTRNPGAHMAVAEDGNYAGSFSGGCVEAAVVAEAQEAIAEGKSREIRFGSESPYLDIRLPCGGGIDLLITPISASIASQLLDAFGSRQPATIIVPENDMPVSIAFASSEHPVERRNGEVRINHVPPARLAILGHGATVEHLAKLTQAYGIGFDVFTPDPLVTEAVENIGKEAIVLKTPDPCETFQPDRWTACVFLFHDHDWEAKLMKQSLDSDAFYIGAMGSNKTHATRTELLRQIGASDEAIARMDAPIGLIPSTRDPATLALSILAQVVERYHQKYDRHRMNS